ncbi:hypothetical protein FEZ48_11250 [Marinilactibacillus psychrotolerans]|uniref:Uncharacterized protein n=1 Tax=Marinilactibacillus psychrotolerans TaxID=191770 RepID=A0A5R9C067_9LACT|nr:MULTISPECIES: hypothetical protein [Marinilactibacillus]API89048.1 hypothetical protein BKP56_07175 [Marinilactibacillus sp. 15R]TLQ06061.1 hypothetical protein FEZ48_11250 [Marinilactibacillus psychrotolerans]
MNYNDRVTIYEYQEEKDALGSIKRVKVPIVVPCARGKLTHEQQMGFFGKYNLSAFKLHLQGVYEGLDEVKYKNTIRSVTGIIPYENATVVVIG